MAHCNGRLFDGSACNNDLIDCAGCGANGCIGDGCDNQLFAAQACGCGSALASPVSTLAVSAAA